jgi:hypothetical protein
MMFVEPMRRRASESVAWLEPRMSASDERPTDLVGQRVVATEAGVRA